MLSRLTVPILALAYLISCASGRTASPEAAASPVQDSTEAPLAEEEPVNLEIAQKLVAQMQAQWPESANQQLLQPSSLDDVLRILKLDQLIFFERGVRFARTLDSLQAGALEAQIELAWGESYLLLLEIMLNLTDEFEQRETELAALAEPNEAERKELLWLRDTIHRSDRLAEAFQLLSILHTTRGSARADRVIAEHPDSYLGYRIASDYYRMVRDWKSFGEMLAKIEERNPNSNGLVFQRGAAAFQRDGDRKAAEKHFRHALERDPDFVRAQAHLVVMQPDIEKIYAEYQKLKALNPDHQIVHWAGEGIEWAYERRKAATAR